MTSLTMSGSQSQVTHSLNKCCILDYANKVNNVGPDDHEEAPSSVSYNLEDKPTTKRRKPGKNSEPIKKSGPTKTGKVEVQLKDVPEPIRSDFAKQLKGKTGKIFTEDGGYILQITEVVQQKKVLKQSANKKKKAQDLEEQKELDANSSISSKKSNSKIVKEDKSKSKSGPSKNKKKQLESSNSN